jgi:hypothetical protein
MRDDRSLVAVIFSQRHRAMAVAAIAPVSPPNECGVSLPLIDKRRKPDSRRRGFPAPSNVIEPANELAVMAAIAAKAIKNARSLRLVRSLGSLSD